VSTASNSCEAQVAPEMSNVNVYKSKTPAMANRTTTYHCLAAVDYVVAHKPCILLERTHRRGQQSSQT
jgi:hypothetical protein